MTTVSGITEMQLIEPGAGLSAEDASFTLTTTSWQRNKISFYHESIAYTILCFYIGVFITLILLALMYHHIIYEIVGVIGCLLTLLLCVLYYIKHCFGVFLNMKIKLFLMKAQIILKFIGIMNLLHKLDSMNLMDYHMLIIMFILI
eukprot:532309_1